MSGKRKKKGYKSRGNFLKENYRKSCQYLKESRVFIYAAVFSFLFFVFIGAFVPAPEIIEMRILEFIEELLKMTEGLSQWELVRFILLNNVQSAFFGMIFGVILGIFSLITAVANGYLLGFVSIRAVNADGILALWRLFPHGIFELPALFVSVGLGLKLGSFIFRKNKWNSLKNYLAESLRVFIFIVIPFLVLAAIIEGNLIFFFTN